MTEILLECRDSISSIVKSDDLLIDLYIGRKEGVPHPLLSRMICKKEAVMEDTLCRPMTPQGQTSRAVGSFSNAQAAWICKVYSDGSLFYREDSGESSFLILFYAVVFIKEAWCYAEIRETSPCLHSSVLCLALQ